MSLIDTLSRALYDAAAGYQDYQQRVKPALDEQAFIRGERTRAQTERDQALAARQLQQAHSDYGGPQGAAQHMPGGIDAYNALRKKAGLMEIGTRDQPITDTTTTDRLVYDTKGPFQDVVGPSSLEVPGAPLTIPRGVTGAPGGTGIPASGQPTVIPQQGLSRVTQGGQVTQEAPQLPADVPQVQQDVQTRATGQTQRVLDLPVELDAHIIQTPIGPMPLGMLKQIPDAILKSWFPDPMVRARLAFDIANAQITHDIARARDVTTRYVHDTASANAIIQARLRQMEILSTHAFQQQRIALEQGRLDLATKAEQDLQKYRAEANNIRYQRLLQAGKTLDAMKDSTMVSYLHEITLEIKDLEAEPDAAVKATPLWNTKRENLLAIQQDARQRIDKRVHNVPGATPPPSLNLNYSPEPPARSSFNLGPVAPAGPAGASPTPPAQPGPGAATFEVLPNGEKLYHSSSGALRSTQVQMIIREMVRQGKSRAQVRQALLENGIPPANFGYPP